MQDLSSVQDYECFDCEITDFYLDKKDLIFECLNGYSRTKLIFKGILHFPDEMNIIGARIHNISQRSMSDGYTKYLIEFGNGFDNIDIVAKKKEYIN